MNALMMHNARRGASASDEIMMWIKHTPELNTRAAKSTWKRKKKNHEKNALASPRLSNAVHVAVCALYAICTFRTRLLPPRGFECALERASACPIELNPQLQHKYKMADLYAKSSDKQLSLEADHCWQIFKSKIKKIWRKANGCVHFVVQTSLAWDTLVTHTHTHTHTHTKWLR